MANVPSPPSSSPCTDARSRSPRSCTPDRRTACTAQKDVLVGVYTGDGSDFGNTPNCVEAAGCVAPASGGGTEFHQSEAIQALITKDISVFAPAGELTVASITWRRNAKDPDGVNEYALYRFLSGTSTGVDVFSDSADADVLGDFNGTCLNNHTGVGLCALNKCVGGTQAKLGWTSSTPAAWTPIVGPAPRATCSNAGAVPVADATCFFPGGAKGLGLRRGRVDTSIPPLGTSYFYQVGHASVVDAAFNPLGIQPAGARGFCSPSTNTCVNGANNKIGNACTPNPTGDALCGRVGELVMAGAACVGVTP